MVCAGSSVVVPLCAIPQTTCPLAVKTVLREL